MKKIIISAKYAMMKWFQWLENYNAVIYFVITVYKTILIRINNNYLVLNVINFLIKRKFKI